MAQAILDPKQPDAAFPMLWSRASPDRRSDVLVSANPDNHVRWTPGERLHHLFEQTCDALAADGEADRLAVDCPQTQLSYAALDAAANRLARWLIAQGYGAGDILALMFDRSAQSYIALLAVSKINAAYAPLDPCFPLDRVDFICDDAGAKAILTLGRFVEGLAGARVPIFALDEREAEIDAFSGARLSVRETPTPVSELSYVIYTSGSTGRPKGVPIEQASICNFVRVAAAEYGYSRDDRVYQGLTLAFDFSVEEILVPLMAGATLAPNQTGGSLVGPDLANFLAEQRITALCCVPTLLATIDADLPDLRLVIVSGEACPQDLVARWCGAGRRMLNAYGPTETTVTCTVCELKPGAPVTIGRPLPTYSAVVLAPGERKLLPFGETGELCIGGVGLSPGYLNRDEKTSEAFIDDFIGLPDNPSSRIYRTGDLVRVNEKREIEYLGRIDTQVKIRGYRIELAEIESVIMESPLVAQAVVDAYEAAPGVKELVAYFTLAEGSAGKSDCEIAAEIAEAVRERLPGFMQPAYYERLDAIPLLPSDKADRKALPPPSRPRMALSSGAHVEPTSKTEMLVASTLTRLLGVERVSAAADFFDELGANSLQMGQMAAKLRAAPGCADVAMRDVYAHRNVCALAAHIDRAAKNAAPMATAPEPHRASNAAYYAFGCAQLGVALLFGYLGAVLLFELLFYVIGAAGWWASFGRALAAVTGLFILAAVLPIAIKWLVWGRFREETFPIWSLRHFQFWFVKNAIRSSPLTAVPASPLYIAHLKLLGAKVDWDSAIFLTKLPVCADLISIGKGAILREGAFLSGYKAEAGRIRIGAVTVGEECFVGEGAVVDINTVMEPYSELAHSSALLEGGRLAAGRPHHGSPAEPTAHSFKMMPWGRVSRSRKIWYTLLTTLPGVLLAAAGVMFMLWLYDMLDDAGVLEQSSDLFRLSLWSDGLALSGLAAGLFVFGYPIALLVVAGVPRLIWMLLREDRNYKLFGVNHILFGMVKGGTNVQALNHLFGDSSYVVGYLRWIGYKFSGGVVQSGSNFGMEQKHDAPYLCDVGRGTMVSDGLQFMNADYSAGGFRLSATKTGENCFFGNAIRYPSQTVLGDNILVGTKTMLPVHGERRSDVGLLGSPAFEIPRSVRSDAEIAGRLTEAKKAVRLQRKNRHNIGTMGWFLLTRLVMAVVMLLLAVFVLNDLGLLSPIGFVLLGVLGLVAFVAIRLFAERASIGFGRHSPTECAVLDPYFWRHERYWKVGTADWTAMFNETPLKGFILRLQGAKVGRRLYDEGGSISERTMIEIGDDCCFNADSAMQGHSLEDGAFKSGRIVIGDGVTLDVSSFVHYSTRIGDRALIKADCFIMKGSTAPADTIWAGNPAEAVRKRRPSQAARGAKAAKRRDRVRAA